jgi:hypothetical protein
VRFAGYSGGGAGATAVVQPQNYSPPIDVPTIRSDIQWMLEDPACDIFIQYLLIKVSADKSGTLMENGDILRIFDRINRPADGGAGMVRAGQPGSQSGFAQANGSFADRNAQIQLGLYQGGVPTAKLIRRGDARMALDETMHHAGRNVYYDYDYALVISKLPGQPPLPEGKPEDRYGKDRTKYSNYWHPVLHGICK